MHNSNLLYRLTALVMLVFFTLSITPKLYLHAVFANHTDTVYKKSPDGSSQVSKTGFACDCNNQVATSPFTQHHETPAIGIVRVYQSFIPYFTSQIHTSAQFFYELRGPPVPASSI